MLQSLFLFSKKCKTVEGAQPLRPWAISNQSGTGAK
jgi:hypothetical protein